METVFARTAGATQDTHESRLAVRHVASAALYTAQQRGSFELVASATTIPAEEYLTQPRFQ